MERNLNLRLSDKERDVLVQALEVLKEQYLKISDSMADNCRYLSQGFSNEAALTGALITRVVDLIDIDKMRANVIDLLGRNKKIDAIRLVRNNTSMGLREAKEYVDGIEAELKHPLNEFGDSPVF